MLIEPILSRFSDVEAAVAPAWEALPACAHSVGPVLHLLHCLMHMARSIYVFSAS